MKVPLELKIFSTPKENILFFFRGCLPIKLDLCMQKYLIVSSTTIKGDMRCNIVCTESDGDHSFQETVLW